MASSQKLISILFLIITLFSIEIQARDFFSKTPSANINNNEQQTSSSVPNKEEQTASGKTEQEPRFIPQTQNGYGLYGHESGQFPPSATNTKETYEPYVTPVRFHPDEPYNSIPESKINNKDSSYFYSKSAEQQNFGEDRFTEKGWSNEENQNNNEQNLGEAVFTEKGWSTKENQNNNNNNNYYNGNNGYKYNNGEKQNFGEAAMFTEKENQNNNNNNKYYNGNNGYNNGERQGMSDTRFLENGKYYYDLKSEDNYYPNQFENSRRVTSRNEFNENRYNNNYNNNRGRYNQNQEGFEENEEEEFEP